MNPIDPAGALAGLLRRQADAARRRTGGVVKQIGNTKDAPGDVDEGARSAALLSSRVKAIDPDDPQRATKALRVLIEHSLLAEFGESLINDAGFFRMVDEVVAQMMAAPDLAAPIEEAVATLLRQA